MWTLLDKHLTIGARALHRPMPLTDRLEYGGGRGTKEAKTGPIRRGTKMQRCGIHSQHTTHTPHQRLPKGVRQIPHNHGGDRKQAMELVAPLFFPCRAVDQKKVRSLLHS